VILGLLVGGVLAGKSLIRAAELRAAVSEYQRYSTAVMSFRDKYFAIPGDMTNATRFWSRQSASGNCVTNSGTAVATPGTCDGNGDGTILRDTGLPGSEPHEMWQFWRQLALAEMIEGNYSGVAGPSSYIDFQPGTNMPKSKVPNGVWGALNVVIGVFPGNSISYSIDYGNYFILAGGTSVNLPLLTPQEAWNMDVKLDDGKPSSGKIVAQFWDNACATGGASEFDLANSVYNLSNQTVQCSFYFPKAF